MKAFHTCIRPRSIEEAAKLALLLRKAGYGGVALELEDFSRMSRVFEDAGLEVYPRATLRVKRASDISRIAVEARRRGATLVAVIPENEEVVRYAARDYRVDIIVYKPGYAKLIDSSQARLHRIGGGAIEVDASIVLKQGRFDMLRSIQVALRRGVAYNVPLILTSCVTSVWDVIAARSIEAFATILGIHPNYAKLVVYHTPWSVVREALRKR